MCIQNIDDTAHRLGNDRVIYIDFSAAKSAQKQEDGDSETESETNSESESLLTEGIQLSSRAQYQRSKISMTLTMEVVTGHGAMSHRMT